MDINGINRPLITCLDGSCFLTVVRSDTGLSGSPGTRPTWQRPSGATASDTTTQFRRPREKQCAHFFGSHPYQQ